MIQRFLRASAWPSARRSRSPVGVRRPGYRSRVQASRRPSGPRPFRAQPSRPGLWPCPLCPCLHARTLNASHTPADATHPLNSGRLHSIKVAAGLIRPICPGEDRSARRHGHALLTMKALNRNQEIPCGLSDARRAHRHSLSAGCARSGGLHAHGPRRSPWRQPQADLDTMAYGQSYGGPAPVAVAYAAARCPSDTTPPTGSMPATGCGSWSTARKVSPTPMRSMPAAPSPCR